MAGKRADILARDLGRLLGEMAGHYDELAMHMRGKLEAIKEADSDRIRSITARETTLADRLTERDGLRRQLMKQLIQALELAEDQAPQRVTELAEFYPEPRRSQLLVQAAGLKEKVQEVEQMRVTTTLITQEMLKHLEIVTSAMTAGVAPEGAYSQSGNRVKPVAASVFEAVG